MRSGNGIHRVALKLDRKLSSRTPSLYLIFVKSLKIRIIFVILYKCSLCTSQYHSIKHVKHLAENQIPSFY